MLSLAASPCPPPWTPSWVFWQHQQLMQLARETAEQLQ